MMLEKNIIFLKFQNLNNLIGKNWLALSLNSFKIHCKDLFLKCINQCQLTMTLTQPWWLEGRGVD